MTNELFVLWEFKLYSTYYSKPNPNHNLDLQVFVLLNTLKWLKKALKGADAVSSQLVHQTSTWGSQMQSAGCVLIRLL